MRKGSRRLVRYQPVPFEVDVTMLLKTIQGYRLNIRAAVRALWSGTWDYYAFLDEMSLAIERGFTQAWYEGARIYGINPNELTLEEHTRLTSEVNKEIGFIANFGQTIYSNSKMNGGKLAPLLARSDLWVSGYNRIRVMASTYAAKDQKLEWRLGATLEHCADCTRYHGKVHRASVWRKNGIQPRMYDLECRGYNCQCELIPTNAPATRGSLSRPRGRMKEIDEIHESKEVLQAVQ